MTEMPAVVPDRVRCMACGCPLWGLPPTAGCPSCGVAVRWSWRAPLLERGDVEWVKRLSAGASWAGVSMLVVLVLSVAVIVLRVALRPAAAATGQGGLSDALGATLGVLIALAWMAHVGGWLALLTADPGVTTRERARWMSRIAWVVALATTVLAFAAFRASRVQTAGLLLSIVAFGASQVAFVEGVIYLRGLAFRLPSRPVYRAAGFRVWFCPLMWVMGLGTFLLCFLAITPIVGIVLYYELLARVHGELAVVVRRMERAQGEASDAEAGAT